MGPNGVAIKPAHVEIMMNWPVPKNVKELQSFLGFCNHHSGHMAKFAELADPLNKFLSKMEKSKLKRFQLDQSQLEIFDKLKQMMLEAPILKYPHPDRVFILDVDASDTAIAGELLQLIDGKEYVISFSSFVLTPTQRNYCTTRRELLSIVRHCNHFRHYLLGRKFICRTDHNSLVWLLGFKNVQGILPRWIEVLASFDMCIIHRPGREHVNADSLSRIPDTLDPCPNYTGNVKLEDLPCYSKVNPCKFCTRAEKQWSKWLDNVDYVVPLSIRKG